MKDLYEILGVQSDCLMEVIRLAYKSKARELHPDKATSSTEAFQELNEAYSILRDPEKRAKYDAGECTDDIAPMKEVAMARLGGLFQQAIATADDYKDMIEIIRSTTASGSLRMQADIDKLNAEIIKYKHVMDRVEYTGDGGDIFTGQAELSISGMEDQVSHLSDEIEITKIVLGMLNDYTCKVDERATKPQYTGDYPGGIASTGWGL